MLKLLQSTSPKELLTKHLPAFTISVVIAELFYKWHSFTLELLGFMATYMVAEALINGVARLFSRKHPMPESTQ